VRALVLALLALALAAPAAQAHATLESTAPQRGATVHAQPRQVVFGFNEPVEGTFGAVRVFDARARRVDDNHVSHPGGVGSKLAVGLKPNLPKGTYTATYRVISADGHLVSGGLVFSVGRAGAAPAESVADLIGGSTAGPATQTAFAAAKAVGYLAIALALGGLIFLVAVWRPALALGGRGLEAAAAPFARRARMLLALAAGLGAAATAAGIVLEGATAAGTSFWGALDRTVIGDVIDTRFGSIWALRLAVWLVLGLGLVVLALRRAPAAAALRPALAGAGAGVRGGGMPGGGGTVRGLGGGPRGAAAPLPTGPAAVVALAVIGGLLALTPALAGHARTQSPVALLVPADVLHVVAMSAWLGGLVFLVLAVPAATRALEPEDRTRLLAGALARFSPLALAAVATLAVTGVVQAYVEVRHLDALTSTAFGRAVLIKVGLLAVLIGLGALNRQRTVPALRRVAAGGGTPGAAGRLLRRTLRAEVALILVVLGVTGALTGYAPPIAAAGGPVSVSQRMGPLDLELTVDPARVGPNEVHMYLFRARDGAPFAGTKELTAEATLPGKGIGPLPLTLRKAGPGHYVADAATLSPAGDWRLQVADRVSDFDQYTTAVKVPVR
jgi:copper transport protein